MDVKQHFLVYNINDRASSTLFLGVFIMHNDWKQIVMKELNKSVQPAFILVFGSFADGTAREDSDLDLAYYSNKTLNSYERFILAGEIADQCNVDIDLVDIRQVDTVFAAEIFSSGEAISCTD